MSEVQAKSRPETTAKGHTEAKGHQEAGAKTAPAPVSPPSAVPAPVSDTALGGSVKLSIAGLDVVLPVKFRAGQSLTENQAKILDAAYQRQFTNNQAANAKARADRFAKAKTDAERAANASLSASEMAAIYADYEPAVGDTIRTDMLTRLRQEAAWRVWVAMVTEHNESVKTGGKPVFARAAGKPVELPSKAIKTKDAAGTEVTVTLADQRNNLADALLARPAYADRIQIMLDSIMAERGKAKETVATSDAVASGEDLL